MENWSAHRPSTSLSPPFSDEEVHLLASDLPKKRAGRRIFKETRHPVYRGVRRRNSDKWVCEVREPSKKTRIWLGTYPTAEMAARAHDVAALALKGRSACLNFADSAWLPLPSSTDANDIRVAAVAAAEEFGAREMGDRNGERSVNIGAPQSEEEKVGVWPENAAEYMDEEAMFDPGLLSSMAEGMLLSPPPPCFETDNSCSGMEGDTYMSLWSFQ
uniref:CBF1 n=1 Tax=Santalum album TaxID=35974 RepID=A0A220BFA8_SANAL|nr:CBF1 [Santalum album]